MKRAGRISPLAVIGVVCILLLIPLFFITQKGPENVAADFMVALGKGDADTLAKLSYLGNDDQATRLKEWQQCIEVGRHYVFTWRITDVTQSTPDSAAIQMQMRRNLQLAMGKDEMKFELPMRKINGAWKVDVGSMDREIYPALPRT